MKNSELRVYLLVFLSNYAKLQDYKNLLFS